MSNAKDMIKYSLIGGIFGGVLSAIPLVNLLCCLWFVAGGALSTYLLGKNEKIKLTDGAVVGALSGIFAAIVDAVIGVIFGIGTSMPSLGGGEEMAIYGGIALMSGALALIVLIPIGAVFGAIGGVITAKLLEKK